MPLDDELRARLPGIADDVAEARGYALISDPDNPRLVAAHFSDAQRQAVPLLYVPAWSVTGEPLPGQVRPDTPRVLNGKTVKYESPKDGASFLDCPPTIRDRVRKTTERLSLTEGSKKADAAVSAGLLCLALPGVWNWKGKGRNGVPSRVLEDFDEVPLKGREVAIAFDSDLVDKPQVRAAMRRLAAMLKRRGARVLVVRLPDDDGAKVGLDDYLAAGHSVDDLDALTEPYGEREGGDGDEPKESPAVAVLNHVERHYDLGVTTDGWPYALPRKGIRRPIMLGEKGGRLRLTVADDLYRDERRIVAPTAVDTAMTIVRARALKADPTPIDLRVAERPGRLVIDLGEAETSRCVEVDVTGWRVLDEPPPGVLFDRNSATRPLPRPVEPGDLDALRVLLGFEVDDDRWLLCLGWLIGACFPSIPRPLLALVGQAGSAKSTRGRFLVSVLDPRAELGTTLGKNLTDDQVKALRRYLVGYDNVSAKVSEATSDFLCRLVTGDSVEKRTLYSDGDLWSADYSRTGVLTGLSLPLLKADGLERLIPVNLDRIDETERIGEREIEAAFGDAHPAILAGLLDALVVVLRRLPELDDVPRPRFADYFDVLRAYDDEVATAYVTAMGEVMLTAAEDDPIVSAVVEYLSPRLPKDGTLKVEPTDAFQSVRAIASRQDAPYFPTAPRTFSAALIERAEPFRALGYSVRRGLSNSRRVLIFERVERVERVEEQRRNSDTTATQDREQRRNESDASLPESRADLKERPASDASDATRGTSLPRDLRKKNNGAKKKQTNDAPKKLPGRASLSSLSDEARRVLDALVRSPGSDRELATRLTGHGDAPIRRAVAELAALDLIAGDSTLRFTTEAGRDLATRKASA